MNEVEPLKEFVSEIQDLEQAANVREHAAKQALILLQENNCKEEQIHLARLIFSRWLDDDSDVPNSTELRGLWRVTDISSISCLNDPSKLSNEECGVLAKILYEQGKNVEAKPYFSRAADSKTWEAGDELLSIYNLENYSRAYGNLNSVNEAINKLTDVTLQQLSNFEKIEVEVKHLLGHMYLLSHALSKDGHSDFAYKGTEMLREAAASDPSYISCATSSLAERGDYIGAIIDSLKALSERRFDSLQEPERTLVALEIIFYLGHAYSSVGEYERSRKCFKFFLENVEGKYREEARDLAELFLVKLEIKSNTTSKLTQDDLSNFYRRLRALSFRSPLSQVVSEEAERYEGVVTFLQKVLSLKDVFSNTSEDYSGRLIEAVARGTEFARKLLGDSINTSLSDYQIGLVLFEGDEENSFKNSLVGNSNTWNVVSVNEGNVWKQLFAMKNEYDVIGVAIDMKDLIKAEQLLSPLPKNLIVWNQGDSLLSYGNLLVVDDLIDFVHLLNLGASLAIIKRFLMDDPYIFGLTPCVESPATRFQRPTYDLFDFLD